MNGMQRNILTAAEDGGFGNHWLQRALPYCACALLAAALAGCAAPGRPSAGAGAGKNHGGFVQLPLVAGWYEGQRVYYITADASDKGAATALMANYAPRLANAVPDSSQVPGQRSTLERIYAVTNFDQGNVLPSSPLLAGSQNEDKAYSPLWRMFTVTWQPGALPIELRSEEAILAAVDRGWVALASTGIVVNCPVIYSARGGLLPGATLLNVVP